MAGKTAILSLKIIGDATSAQKATEATEKAVGGLEKAMGTATKGATVAGAAAGAGLLAGLDSALKADQSNRQLAAAMGLTPAESETAGKIAGDLYKNAYGESLEQVNGVINGVATNLADLSANGGADVERLTEKALNLAAAFPEVGDGVQTAGILVKTGLAKSADEAYDLMTGTLQKMTPAMQAELIPVMDEYAKHFADLGIDGTTAFGIIAEASKGGAIQMDKTGDALKEFTIRATDGSEATATAYESIGLSAEEMARKIAEGGPAAQEAFAQTVAGLQSIEDPAAQAQAAIGLFGTPLEDLGTAKIPEFLGAIDPAGDAFDSLAGSATAMGETLNAGPSVALETLKRTAMDSLTQIGAAALPVLGPIIAILQQYAPVIGPIAVAVAALAAVVWLVNGALSAWRAIVLISTAAQWAWNAAMAANPIGIIILLIAALVAGIILAYNNIGWFKDAVDTAGRVAGDIFNGIIGWVEDLIGWLDDMLAPVGGISGALETMGVAGQIALDGIIGGIQTAISWVQDAIGWFNDLFGAKNNANSVSVEGMGGTMGLALASPAYTTPEPAPAGMFGAAPPPPPAGAFGAGFGGTSNSLAGAVEAAGSGTGGDTYIKVEVKADATTDAVALGRTLLKTINKSLAATGKPKLGTL